MGLNITYVVWAMIFDKVLLGHDITIKMVICALMVMIGSFVVATQPAHEEELTNVTNTAVLFLIDKKYIIKEINYILLIKMGL